MTDPALMALADILDPPAWKRDPVQWIGQALGEVTWSKQREIAASVRDNRRTAVHSCHDVGKSYIASRTAAWWLSSHRPGEAFVVSTAPTFRQVRNILWREIGRAHRKGRLPGRVNQTEWWLDDEIVGFGAKPDDTDPAAFQGIHARYVLVVIDEACGVPEALWDAADALITNTDSRMLAIGNPDDPGSHFAKVCLPGSGWNVVHVDAYDSPAFTGESIPEELAALLISRVWVEERRLAWGEDSPIFQAKVRGRFSKDSEFGVIPASSLARCQRGRDYHNEHGETIGQGVDLGVDVGAGGDQTVIAAMAGPRVWIVARDRNRDTMHTVGLVVRAINETGARRVRVDEIGIGKGVCDRLAEQRGQSHHAEVVGVNVGRSSSDPARFLNVRSELWWDVGRSLCEETAWDLERLDDEAIGELLAPRYKLDSRGRVVVEPKDEVRKRLGRSPDSADAVLLAAYRGAAGSPAASVNRAGTSPEPVVRRGDLVLRGAQYVDKDPTRR